ncbi:MAG: hypothetical protein M1360_03950 [Candidatus Marsarchaeota archaeon]|jgi:hypothetical protein|nr:hypothetical protein [Candidatus Marsarchaeota archaeon]MCL5419064.1 hypothetical protein [Candidatus Marsarchaeota archaeon]
MFGYKEKPGEIPYASNAADFLRQLASGEDSKDFKLSSVLNNINERFADQTRLIVDGMFKSCVENWKGMPDYTLVTPDRYAQMTNHKGNYPSMYIPRSFLSNGKGALLFSHYVPNAISARMPSAIELYMVNFLSLFHEYVHMAQDAVIPLTAEFVAKNLLLVEGLPPVLSMLFEKEVAKKIGIEGYTYQNNRELYSIVEQYASNDAKAREFLDYVNNELGEVELKIRGRQFHDINSVGYARDAYNGHFNGIRRMGFVDNYYAVGAVLFYIIYKKELPFKRFLNTAIGMHTQRELLERAIGEVGTL